MKKSTKASRASKKAAVTRRYNERIANATSKAQATALKAAKTRAHKAIDADV